MADISRSLERKYGSCRAGSDGWFYIPCPTCEPKDRNKKKRWVRVDRTHSDCWICGIQVDTLDILGLDGDEAAEFKAAPPSPPKPPDPRSFEVPATRLVSLTALPKDHPAVLFLAKDHIVDLARIEAEFEASWIPPDGGVDLLFGENKDRKVPTGGSLFFPVFSRDKMIGWQLRFIEGCAAEWTSKLRYMHIFDKGNHLYGADRCELAPYVVVVEGVKKAWKHPFAVATLGKSITDKQLRLLARWPKVVFALDSGTEKEAAKYAASLEAAGVPALVAEIGETGVKSPDEMTAGAFEEFVACVINCKR